MSSRLRWGENIWAHTFKYSNNGASSVVTRRYSIVHRRCWLHFLRHHGKDGTAKILENGYPNRVTTFLILCWKALILSKDITRIQALLTWRNFSMDILWDLFKKGFIGPKHRCWVTHRDVYYHIKSFDKTVCYPALRTLEWDRNQAPPWEKTRTWAKWKGKVRSGGM